MKNAKNRVLSLLLVLLMSISLLPLSAIAAESTGFVFIESDIFGNANDKIFGKDSYWGTIGLDTKEVGSSSVTIKASDYSNLVEIGGELYELEGMHSFANLTEDTVVSNGVTSITIPAFPVDGTEEEQEEWYNKYVGILLAYAPHRHDYSRWYISATNHWRECLECREQNLNLNWHSDEDADGICDICQNEIVYYDITIAETTGGTVSIEKEKAALNDEIVVTVAPGSGNVVDEVHFYKLRNDGTRAELVRHIDEAGKTYHFDMPSFDCEIVVTFKAA